MNWILVFLGGGIGSVLRYFLSWMVGRFTSVSFPISTLLSNVISSLLFVGFVYISSVKMNEQWRFFFLTGVCGGFSTFSTFSFETFELFRQGNVALASLNILLNVLLCVGLFYLILKTK